MPGLNEYHEIKVIKMLYIGDSGTAKTGALASLAKAGYKLRILDADNGIDSLAEQLRNDPIASALVDFQTVVDKKKSMKFGSKIKIICEGGAKAFGVALDLLNHWKYKDGAKDIDLGKPCDWGRDTVLVVDSLDHLGTAALDYNLELVARGGEQPQIQDYGSATRQLEQVIQLLCSSAIGCHVIIISHINQVEIDTGEGVELVRGYPAALGSKLSPKIGAYFNTTLIGKASGSGDKVKRVIRTVPTASIDAKNPVKGIPAELPVEEGLATFFKAYLGGHSVAESIPTKIIGA